MSAYRIPFLTLGLVLALAGLHWLMPDKTLLYFSTTDIMRGEIWRVLTGHFVHADWEHLLWNGLGLAVLGALIEQHSRTLLWIALGTGVASVSILLLTPFSQLDYYCGLSGVLNTLLLTALWLEWRRTRSGLIIAVACGCVMKVIIEVSLGASIITHISWPPYAWSHVAGLIGGFMLVMGGRFLPFMPSTRSVPGCPRAHQQRWSFRMSSVRE